MNKKYCEIISHPPVSCRPVMRTDFWDDFREKDSHSRNIKTAQDLRIYLAKVLSGLLNL